MAVFRREFLAAWAALAATPLTTACGGGGGAAAPAPPPAQTPPPPPPPPGVAFTNVSVHDPAVIAVDGRWHIFGSHLAAASTDDLMNWSLTASGVDDRNPLFGNRVTTELAEALAWAQTDTLWAPDVVRLADGRYRMYYCACEGSSPRSALGLAVADAVQGPYTHERLLLKSGQWGQPSEDGTVYDATVHPNVVDPAVFTDAAGALWMVYGSYSGGLFILALDAATGLPIAGQGYGRHLMGGHHARIEGACILHSPESGWYHLFVSFGGLAADGGYNVRVARSRHPDGPYVDGAGTDMATVMGAPGTLFDDASIAPHGMKLMGGHQFALADGETGTPPGYVSPGHNAVARDAATGELFIVFHTRFPGTGELHEVRVHPMHLNAEGWPVIAPLRHVPLSRANPAQPAEVSAADAAGRYKLIDHGKDITAVSKDSVDVTLGADGRLGGALTGTWAHGGGNHVTLTVGGTAYAGVLSRQWNPNANAFVVTFSALSAAGVALWAIRTGV